MEYIEVENSRLQNETAEITTNGLDAGESYEEMRNVDYDISQYSSSYDDISDNGQRYQNANMLVDDEKTPQRNFNEPHEPRAQKEFLNVANAWQIQMDELGIRESKWNGELIVIPDDEGYSSAPIGREICITETASDLTVLHELLHTRSVWHYDDATYYAFWEIEEASVEFLTRELAKINGFKLLEAENDVALLHEINKYAKICETDLEFAKKLFEQDLPERSAWLIKNLNENIVDESKRDELFNELSRRFLEDVI